MKKIIIAFFTIAMLLIACTKDRIIDINNNNGNNGNNGNGGNPGANSGKLVINEFMAGNLVTLANPDSPSDYHDWVELYNTGDTPVDIANYYFSDDTSNTLKFRFPTGSTKTIVPPKGYLVIFCSGVPSLGPLNVGFSLSKAGESIILSDASENKIDAYNYGQQTDDISEGRRPNGTGNFVFMNMPTPGAMNN